MQQEFTEVIAKNVKPKANVIDMRIFERNHNGKITFELFINNDNTGTTIMLPFEDKEVAYGNFSALLSILEGEEI